MPNDQRNSLYSLQLLFGPKLLTFEFDLIFLNVVFLDVKELKVSVELLKLIVKVLFFGFAAVSRFEVFVIGQFDFH